MLYTWGHIKMKTTCQLENFKRKHQLGDLGIYVGRKKKGGKKKKSSDSVENSQWTLWLQQWTLNSIGNGNFLLTEQLSRSEVSKQWYWGFWSSGMLPVQQVI